MLVLLWQSKSCVRVYSAQINSAMSNSSIPYGAAGTLSCFKQVACWMVVLAYCLALQFPVN